MVDKRFTLAFEDYDGWAICDTTGEYSNDEDYIDWLSGEKAVDVMNHFAEENEQLKSDKEHLMGCLIRFFGYDDEDIDYNLNRESNRDFGKQYYSMKEETKKELEE